MDIKQLCNCVVTGKLGAWLTLSCENVSSSYHSSSSTSYSTRSVQPPQNSLRTTVVQTFTAQYSQPGHFGLLLVSHVGINLPCKCIYVYYCIWLPCLEHCRISLTAMFLLPLVCMLQSCKASLMLDWSFPSCASLHSSSHILHPSESEFN